MRPDNRMSAMRSNTVGGLVKSFGRMICAEPTPPMCGSSNGTISHFRKLAFQIASSSVKQMRSVLAASMPAR